MVKTVFRHRKATERPGKGPRFANDCDRRARNYIRDEEGLVNEGRVLRAFYDRGRDVLQSEAEDDIERDIDAYIDGVATSVKTQDTGVRFGHIYVELATEQGPVKVWEEADRALVSSVFPENLHFGASWRPAWFFTGAGSRYAISQRLPDKRRVRVYEKPTISAYIQQKGFDRVCGLSWPRLQSQNGFNTVCGFLPVDAVPYIEEFFIS
jgi:hypothetical protein